MKYRKINFLFLFLFSILFLFVGATFFANRITLNFHRSLANEIYRSGQLTYKELTALEKKYHFKAIINLRGFNIESPWYQEETQFSKKYHLSHYDHVLPWHGMPSWEVLSALVYTITNSEKPILLHCRAGADRTGLASAIALILAGASQKKVKKEISWHYSVFSPSTVGYQVMQNYFMWLVKQHLAFGKESFLQWVTVKPKLIPQFGWYF